MPEPHPDDLLSWLRGRWTVQRTINDDGDHFSGTATFTPTDTGVTRWQEQGELTLGAYTGPAHRTLLLARGPGATHLVSFNDGRPFHELDLSDGHAEARHLCGADTYRGAFTVQDGDHFTVIWHVTGPGRDDTIASDYARAAQADARAA